MAAPLFVIGPQRTGTTVTARVLAGHPDIGPEPLGFCPYDRWDIAAAAEFGGAPTETPILDKLDRHVGYASAPWFLVKLALPVSVESLLWPRLLERYPDSRVVLTNRGIAAANDSWLKLPYLQDAKPTENGILTTLHTTWSVLHAHQRMKAGEACPRRCWSIEFERLLIDPAAEMAPVFESLLELPPPPPEVYDVVQRRAAV